MILLMLVNSERKLFVAELLHFTRKNDVRAAQHIKFMLVHRDRVQGLRQKVFEFNDVALVRLHSLLVLDEGFE